MFHTYILSGNSKIGPSFEFDDVECFVEFMNVPLFSERDLWQHKVKETR